jgi:cellulose synthase/poly-beta-1,6-N-acetylglucosamine synthase-like glycosyltransferase
VQLLAIVLMAVPLGLLLYSYLGYPILLAIAGRFRHAPQALVDPAEWPTLTITIPCFNEVDAIRRTLESVLALDYPSERRQILVISDASTDGTDELVTSFADRGVELLRLPERRGKTAAENAAAAHLRGEIAVNIDATIKVFPGALKSLVLAFQDPTIGVASGRDISVGGLDSGVDQGEAGYTGYEMWIRGLETRVGSIVGASGCFFASRRALHDSMFPEALSRDFASCLIAWEHGYRAVSVDSARCLVPRGSSLQGEYRRKVRTMSRGLGTLWYKRQCLNPFRYGRFALMLFSHKLCRWLSQLTLPLGALGLVLLSITHPTLAPWNLAGVAGLCGLAGAAWWWPGDRPMPPWLSAPGFAIWANLAGLVAWTSFLRGDGHAIWEPTRRAGVVKPAREATK